MKNKLNLSLVVLTVLFSVMTVCASGVIINNPVSNDNITGTFSLNVTVNGINTTNFTCDFWAKSSLTANNTFVRLIPAGLQNGTLSEFNASFVSSVTLEDANDYAFNVTCSNGTIDENSTVTNVTSATITLENTIPIAATSLTPTSDSDGSVNFSGTVRSNDTTSCTLHFNGRNPGFPSYTMSHAGNSCSHTISSVAEESYIWFIENSDERNYTNSSEQTTSVDIKTGAGKSMTPQQIQEAKAKGLLAAGLTIGGVTIPVPVIIFVVIVAVVVIFVVWKREN